jgi:hypothetical protein
LKYRGAWNENGVIGGVTTFFLERAFDCSWMIGELAWIICDLRIKIVVHVKEDIRKRVV